MVSLQEPLQATTKCGAEPISSPRISFSSDFLDENNFISICPQRDVGERNVDFEFLSGSSTTSSMMMSADELFREGKLLPSWRVEKLPTLKTAEAAAGPTEAETPTAASANHDQDRRISWFLDDDPSPRPPTCTVLWKELLRLKKQRSSTLSPASSSSENSSTDERKKAGGEKSKVKKGLERTKSGNVRIRPMINVPICTARSALPPLRRSSSRLES